MHINRHAHVPFINSSFSVGPILITSSKSPINRVHIVTVNKRNQMKFYFPYRLELSISRNTSMQPIINHIPSYIMSMMNHAIITHVTPLWFFGQCKLAELRFAESMQHGMEVQVLALQGK